MRQIPPQICGPVTSPLQATSPGRLTVPIIPPRLGAFQNHRDKMAKLLSSD